MTERPWEPSAPESDPPIGDSREPRAARGRVRRLGWFLAIPAAAYSIWIIAAATHPGAASAAVGRIFGFFLAWCFIIWLIGVVLHRPGLRGWWGWTIVLTGVTVLLLLGLSVGSPRDIAMSSYIRDGGGYTFEVDQEDQAAFRAAVADLQMSSEDLEEAELFYVKHDAQPVGVLAVLAIRPSLIGPTDSFWSSMRKGLAKAWPSLRDIQIAAGSAVLYEDSGAFNVLWHHENLALISSAADEAVARDIAAALASANDSR